MDFFLLILKDFCFAFCVAVGFGSLFNTPNRVLLIAGILGGLGHSLRFCLYEGLEFGLITSTLSGTVLIGLLGIVLAHRVHTPPIVFTMPACITMIPGMYAYKTMLGFIRLTDESGLSRNPQDLDTTFHNLVLTGSLLFTLAVGISISVLLFRQSSVKMLKFARKSKIDAESV